MNLSLLYPSHANDLHIKTACVPPRTFRHASNCSGIDHQVSGRIPLTPRTISTPSQVNYGRVAFAMAALAVNLANGIHSLARSSKRKIRHRQLTHTTASRRVLSNRRSLHAVSHDHRLVSGTFHFLFRDTFQCSLTLLFRYRF